MKGLWIAMGAKPVTGPFSVQKLKKVGFACPKLQYPLRNPLEIAQNAHKVSQQGAKNLLKTSLQNPIDITEDTNLIKGLLIQIDALESSYIDALSQALPKIPQGKKAMVLIDSKEWSDDFIIKAFKDQERQKPELFRGPKD